MVWSFDLRRSVSTSAAVSTGRVSTALGNVGPIVLHQVREALALIFDLPA